jgi:ketosteroid isomerase-like protein
MKTSAFVFIITFAAVALAFAQVANNQSTLMSLVEAERDFSKASVAKGVREAFIMNLADDATLFHPHAVAGKKWMIDRPAIPGLLTWRPIYADVSRSGDFGYTTGPWEFRKNGPDDKEVAHGNFITVWKKQADATWKVAIDLGISNPPPAGKSEEIQFGETARARSKGGKKDVASEQAALLNAEREFARACEEKGAVNSYLAYATDDVRVFREDKFPFIGKHALGEALAELKGALTWQPAKADASSAGDMGYTYGIVQFKPKGASKIEYFNYMRVWKKQSNGAWKMALDVFNPCPPPQAIGARQ